MTVDWKLYWEQRARQAGSDDPYRQVERVANREPIGDDAFTHICAHLVALLDPRPEDVVLDLCCGNGLLAAAVEPFCRRVVAVDFCAPLLAGVASRTRERTSAVLADARHVAFREASLDRVLWAAAIQHFTPAEVVRLFRRLAVALRPGGVLLVTDIPDRARMWRFHDTLEREDACFQHEADGAPILGTWFDRAWLERLGRHAGFRGAQALDQPSELPYAHYRFDLRCRR
jgi:ubiquinone/menaquinone biosynthesis C-methylase UbiE